MTCLSLPLENLRLQQTLIRDRIRAVVSCEANGIYLHGRPGTAKTYIVKTTLEHLGQRYAYASGHLTPIGLFELIEANPQAVIVLDDVSSIFQQPTALQIFLAALGTPPDGSRIRTIRYKTATTERVAFFEGGIIAISNLRLEGHRNQVLEALRDRVHVMAYEPTDEEIEAAIFEIVGSSPRGVPAPEAWEVAEFLLEQCRLVGIRPSIRLFVDKALADYRLWRAGGCESDWRDLVRSSVLQMVVPQQHRLRNITRREQKALERSLAHEILATYGTREERLEAWRRETGKSQSAFYRHVRREGREVLPLAR